MKNVPVIIIGSGPVGLSVALALARQHVQSLVIERHPGTTQHPRARGVNARSVELFRQWGNASELLKFEQPKEARRFIWAESLQGCEITRVTLDDTNISTISAAQACLVSQDRVEESLYHSLLNYNEAEVQFSKEFISFDESNAGITARILNLANNQEEQVSAQYLVAADGAHSRIRKQLGIEMEGPDNLGQFCSVYCEIDISAHTKSRPCIAYFFTAPNLSGRSLFSVDGANRWIIGMRFSKDNTKEFFSDDYCIQEIRRVVGMPDLVVKIINKSFWTMAAQIASQYRKGRIFLAGDAAHRLPPTGGFGMNTGIQDAHNLAWKLAFVLKHQVSDKLLNTYDEERIPIAKKNIDWSIENSKRYVEIAEAIKLGDNEILKNKLHEQQGNLNYEGLDFGFIYHSKALFSESDQTLSVSPSKYIPTTLPGSRAPHVLLSKDGVIISTLDLFEKEFVLLVGSDGHAWKTSAMEITKTLLYPLKIYRIAIDGDLIDTLNIWHTVYEITSTGAVLIRPDGHVAWRSKSLVAEPMLTLHVALNRMSMSE
jgi:putative polyketide hydroxylase